MKKIGLVIAVICCILFIAYMGTNKEPKEDLKVIKIGAIIPLTGYSAINGERFLQGLNMAIDEINLQKLPFTLKIIVEDSKSTGKDAHFAYKKLVGSGVKYFIGFGGQFVMGFVSETNNSDKVLFASAAPNNNLLELSNRCFRIYPTIDMTAEKVKETIVQNGYKKIAIINLQNEAYSKYAEAVTNKLSEMGIDVVLAEAYDPYCQDFKNIINKIAQQEVDFIYSAGLGESSALLTKQLFTNPKTKNIPVIGDMNYLNPENLAIIGDITAPVYAIDSYMDSTFIQKFTEKYNQAPNALSVYGFVIPHLLKKALLETRNILSKDKVYDYIKGNTFETAAGNISFDSITTEVNLSLVTRVLLPSE